MTRADFEASIAIGVEVVSIVCLDPDEVVTGVDGCVRSKPACEE